METAQVTTAIAETPRMVDLRDRPKLKVTDLNPHLSCILCGGYFIDATTVTECLHSFCRACIVRYLETSKYCPVCEVQIHKTRPLRCIRPDKVLQNIVYKLVPGLYQNEMKRRRELYASQPPEAVRESRDAEDRGEGMEDRFIYTADEMFNLSLEYAHEKKCDPENTGIVEPSRRYLRCPAAITVSHLKKFVRLKYSIPEKYQIDLQFQEESLNDDYTLMDVGYIFNWKRNGLLQFSYKLQERSKRSQQNFRASHVITPVCSEGKSCNSDENKSFPLPKTPSSLVYPQTTSDNTNEQRNERKTNRHHLGNKGGKTTGNSVGRPRKDNSKLIIVPSKSNKIFEKSSKAHSGKGRKAGFRSRKHSSKRASKKSRSSSSRKHSVPKLCVNIFNGDSRWAGKNRPPPSVAIVPPTKVSASSNEKNALPSPPPKVPKLTIPLTPKILQDANSLQQEQQKLQAQHKQHKVQKQESQKSHHHLQRDHPGLHQKQSNPEQGKLQKEKHQTQQVDHQKHAKYHHLDHDKSKSLKRQEDGQKTHKHKDHIKQENVQIPQEEKQHTQQYDHKKGPKSPTHQVDEVKHQKQQQHALENNQEQETELQKQKSIEEDQKSHKEEPKTESPTLNHHKKVPKENKEQSLQPTQLEAIQSKVHQDSLREELKLLDQDEDKSDLDSDLFEGGPLIIAEPLEDSVDAKDIKDNIEDNEIVKEDDTLKKSNKNEEEEIDVESFEVDSGRGSDTSYRTGDDDVGSPGSSTTVQTPDLEKSNPFLIPSPSSLSLPSPNANGASPRYSVGNICNGITSQPVSLATTKTNSEVPSDSSSSVQNHKKDAFGVLDLSTCNRKRGYDGLPFPRPRQVANPPVLDKLRQTTPCLPILSPPSYKTSTTGLHHPNIYKKNTSEFPCRGNFRYNKGSTLTVFNPDPNSNRPKIVIKNIDSPRSEHGHHGHHHHRHHHHANHNHNNNNHQRM